MFKSKADILKIFRSLSRPVDVVLDVGVLFQTKELREIYLDTKQYLFEPMEECFARIEHLYQANNYVLVKKAVGAQSAKLPLFKRTIFAEQPVTHSRIGAPGEQPKPGEAAAEIEVVTLNEFCKSNNIDKNILLKIDVDGKDLDILRGSNEILRFASAVIIETPLIRFTECANFLEANGFVLWELCDFCFYDEKLLQFDCVFLNSRYAKLPEFNPGLRHKTFQRELWQKLP
jgi:FkbM family methyltransferase